MCMCVCVHTFTCLGEAREEGYGKVNWSHCFSQSRTEVHCQFISKSLLRISENILSLLDDEADPDELTHR